MKNMFSKKLPSEKILVLGLGGIGLYLAKRLVHEGYAVTAIEEDADLVRHADGYLDARLITGSAMNIDCWKEAEAENMDCLIAVTNNDAVNMIAARIADKFGIEKKIARVRCIDFGGKDSFLSGEDLNIDLFIHPEELVAQEVSRLIKRTSGNEIMDIALGQMQVVATRVMEDSPFANKNLIEISKAYSDFSFRVVAIARGITSIIPGGQDVILPNDQILIMAGAKDLAGLMDLIGIQQQSRQRVMILGGGLVGARIAELLGNDMQVKLIEKDEGVAASLSAALPQTEVLLGDGADKEGMEMAGLLEMDTFVAATGENETNIMSCLLAKHLMVTKGKASKRKSRKTITLVNKEEYVVLATTSGSDIAINKKILAGNEILTFIRNTELVSISHMHGFDADVMDLVVAPNSPITRYALSNLEAKLAGKIIVGSVFRDGEWETAVGRTHIQNGDRVIVICNSKCLNEVRELFLA